MVKPPTVIETPKTEPKKVRSRAVDVSGSRKIAGEIKPIDGLPLIIPMPGAGSRSKASCNFTKLEPWGNDANQIVLAFSIFSDGDVQRAKQIYSAVKRFLNSLFSTSAGIPPSMWSRSEWEQFTNSYLRSVKNNRKISSVTYNRTRGYVERFALLLRSRGIAPAINFEGPAPIVTKGKKKGIAHVKRLPYVPGTLNEEDQALVDEIDRCSNIGDPEQFSRRNDLLLGRLRRHAENYARKNWHDFLSAEAVISDDQGWSAERFVADYVSCDNPWELRDGWRQHIRTEEAGLKLAARFGPGVLSANCPIGDRLSKTFGIKLVDLRSRIFPETLTLIPFKVLFLLHLDNEISSVRRTKTNCCQRSDDGMAVTVFWDKKRGQAFSRKSAVRPVGSDESFGVGSVEKIETFQCVKRLSVMRERLSVFVLPEDKDILFISNTPYAKYDYVGSVSDAAARYNFTRFREADPVLALFPFSLDKIRSTGMEDEYIKSGGDLYSVKRRAGHEDIGTTVGYVQSEAGSMVDANKARAIHELMVATGTRDHPTLRQNLQLDHEAAEELVRRASQAGMFGYEFQPEGPDPKEKASSFAQWMLSGEHVLLESVPMAAEIIAFEAHLRREAQTLRHYESWETKWVYVLLYLNAAISEMRPDIRKAGEQLALQHEISYSEVS